MEVTSLLSNYRFTQLPPYDSKANRDVEKSGKIDVEKSGKIDVEKSGHVKISKPYELSEQTLKGLTENQFEFLTKVQADMLPPALKDKNLIVQALTGSGKTLGFIIPVLEKVSQLPMLQALQALIIAPTRELAQQIYDTLTSVGAHHNVSCGCCIGGKFIRFEQKIVNKLNIVVGTPGRILQHMDESANFDVGAASMIVIDEIDRLLDSGFGPTIKGILHNHGNPKKRQLILCSATANIKDKLDILKLADRKFEYIDSGSGIKREGFKEYISIVPIEHKVDYLFSLINTFKNKKILVFVETCKMVKILSQIAKKYFPKNRIFELQGRGSMNKRVDTFQEFSLFEDRAVLFSTDLAERGLDIPHLSHVIQFDRPDSIETYIHRVGRTARLNNSGTAILMLSPHEGTFLAELRAISPDICLFKLNIFELRLTQRFIEGLYLNYPKMKEEAARAVSAHLKSVRSSKLNADQAKRLGKNLAVTDYYIPPSIKG